MQRASLTTGMKNALSALTGLQSQIETTNSRLATGKKVNSALDNPLNFFLADGFSTRARGFTSILDNIGLALGVLKQADKALNSIRATLEQGEGTLRASLQTAGSNARMVSTFSFRDAFTGAPNPTANFFAPDTDTSRNRLQSGDSFSIELATFDQFGAVVSSLGSISVTAAGSTVQQVIDAINSTGGPAPLNINGQSPRVFGYLNESGNLVIENALTGRDGLGNTFGIRFITTNAAAATPSQNGLDAFAFSGALGATPTNSLTGTATQTVTIVGSTGQQSPREAAANTFREVLRQMRNLALDAGFNGTNLLQGDSIRTVFNIEETTSITTRGQRIDASTLGFTLDNPVTAQGDAIRNFQSDREIQNALTKIRAAKELVATYSMTFATNSSFLKSRQEFTTETTRNLNDGSDFLTVADMNEEGATLSSLQTRQQLSVTALSLANQSDQAILRLF